MSIHRAVGGVRREREMGGGEGGGESHRVRVRASPVVCQQESVVSPEPVEFGRMIGLGAGSDRTFEVRYEIQWLRIPQAYRRQFWSFFAPASWLSRMVPDPRSCR